MAQTEQQVPLLHGHGDQGSSTIDVEALKASECLLHNSCFLSDGKGRHRPGAAQSRVETKLLVALILCFIFMIIEIVGGYLAHSVAIMSDAAHMMSDVAGFAVSLFAAWIATKRSHASYSFGYHRAEIIGALFSTLIIWAVTGALVWEAIMRVIYPQPVDGKLMFIVASAGIVFNVSVALVLGGHHHHGLAGSECPGHGHSHSHGHDHGHGHSCHGHDHDHDHAHSHEHGHKCSGLEAPAEGVHSFHVRNMGSSGGHSHEGDVEQGHHHHDHDDHDHDHHGHDADHDHDHEHGHSCGHSHSHEHKAHEGFSSAAAPANLPQSTQQLVQHDHDHGHSHDSGHCSHSHEHGHSHHEHAHEEKHGAPGPAPKLQRSSHSHGHSHHGHDHDNINLRSAVLHVLGDIVQSFGVALAGLLIWWKEDDPRWAIADPICTFVFAILVLLTTRSIIRDIINTLMERTPEKHDISELSTVMHQVPGVQDVHDLHVWNISIGIPVLTAHVHIMRDAEHDQVLKRLEKLARKQGIKHSTIQICNPTGPLAVTEDVEPASI